MHRFQELGCSSLLESRTVPVNLYTATKHIEMKRNEVKRNRDADLSPSHREARAAWRKKPCIGEAESRCGFVAEPSRSEGGMAWETVRGIIIKIKKAAHMGSLFEMKRRVLWQRHIYQSVRITKKQF